MASARHRQRPRRRWPKAAVLVLSFAGGCLSGAPPAVPPGWTVHYHQETPYFYNEETGETTWDQPRPAIPSPGTATPEVSTRNAQQPGFPSRSQHPERQPAREHSFAEADERFPAGAQRFDASSGAGAGAAAKGKRGWFGFGRAAVKPQKVIMPQAQAQQQQQQRWQTRGGPSRVSKEYDQAEGRAGSSGGGQERRYSQADLQGAGREWGHSGPRQGLASQQQQETGPRRGQFLNGVGVGEQSRPGSYSHDREERQQQQQQRSWRGEIGVEAWDPLADRDFALQDQSRQSTAAVVGNRDTRDSGATDGTREERPAVSKADIGPDDRDEPLPPAVSPGDVPEASQGRVDANGERWWTDSAAPSAAATGIELEKTAEAGDTDEAQRLAGGGLSPDQRVEEDRERGASEDLEGILEKQHQQQRQQKGDVAGKGKQEEMLHLSTMVTADANVESATTPPLPSRAPQAEGAEGAGADEAASEAMSEWFLPAANEAIGVTSERFPTWGSKSAGVDDGAETEERRGTAREDGSITDVRAATGRVGEVGTEKDTGSSGGALGQEEQLWESGYISQQQRVQHQQYQHQQQHQQGEGEVRHEAEGWDWADPWGQADEWAAPAWATTTDATPPDQQTHASPVTPTQGMRLDNAQSHTEFRSSRVEPSADGKGAGGWEGYGHIQYQGSAGFGAAGEGGVTAGATVEAAEREIMGNHEKELAQALEETRKELVVARKVEQDLRSALREEKEAQEKAVAEATEAQKEAEAAESMLRQQAAEAKENATAVGQWLVTLGMEREELKGKLAAAQSNSTSLYEEVATLRESAREAEGRANSSEAKLQVALEDVEVLDEGLKQYMDGDGHRRAPQASPLTWRRVSDAYLRPLLPRKLKVPTAEEVEAVKLGRSLGRALENNTALAEAVTSKDDLIKDLNSRIKQFQLHAVRRKKGYRALKHGLAELTDEVQSKESMMTILAVCMFGTSATLENMSAALQAQHSDIATLASLWQDREEKVQALTLELEDGARSLTDLRESLHKAESALLAVSSSFGATEDCMQRWKEAAKEGAEGGEDNAIEELLKELHASAAAKFGTTLELEPSTGAITVAVPSAVPGRSEGYGGGEGAVGGRKSPGFWGGVFDVLCCRRRGGS